ncbi:MAG: hypothetical protein E7570_02460 [Ruminococcaceae bacterium]|nr:hypothetical protein [Oscillospiraceae bacterium]
MQKKERNIIIILVVSIVAVLGIIAAIFVMKGGDFLPGLSKDKEVTQQVSSVSGEELDGILRQQPMYVSGIHYYYKGSEERFTHDAMGASVFNSSDVSAKSFIVAFCAFDKDGNPIKIRQPNETGEGGYIRTVTYDYAKANGDKTSLNPNETCTDILMFVNNQPQIVTVKACVKSYVSTEDITWDNPYYKTFTDIYAGKELNE